MNSLSRPGDSNHRVSVFDHVGNFIHYFSLGLRDLLVVSLEVLLVLLLVLMVASMLVTSTTKGFRSLPTTNLITIMCLYFTVSEVTM